MPGHACRNGPNVARGSDMARMQRVFTQVTRTIHFYKMQQSFFLCLRFSKELGAGQRATNLALGQMKAASVAVIEKLMILRNK